MIVNAIVSANLIFAPLQPEEVLNVNTKIAHAILLLSSLPKGEESPLTLNSADRKFLPRHFREGLDPLLIPGAKTLPQVDELPSREGLDTLHASASAQPAEGEFYALAAHYKKSDTRVTVVDLREESTLFINGDAISVFAATNFGNMGKTLDQISEEEKALIDTLLNQKEVTIYKIISKTVLDTLDAREPIAMVVDRIATEQELVAKAGLDYLRLPMTDHMRPNDQAVEAFVTAVLQRDETMHFHFHCWEGHGRTTTVMIMLDAMMNADKVSFNDIWKRQWWLGGEGSNMSNVPAKPNYKHELFDERFQFLSTFYRYCQENREHGFQKSWMHYLDENGINRFLP